jgi:hypothetical protein
MVDFMIFSKNRPMQLHALLSSFKEFAINYKSLNVLYKYDEEYFDSLQLLKSQFADVKFIEETNFKNQVEDFLSHGDFCSFLVDDIIFKDSSDMNQIASLLKNNPQLLCFSLRLGLHLKSCYMVNKAQKIPSGAVHGDIFVWDWRHGEFDWGYPLSVDGHIFRTSDMRNLTSAIQFGNPNQFEDALQRVVHRLESNLCSCFQRSKIVNVPMNRVQDEYKNRNIGVDAPSLLRMWNDGLRISFKDIIDISNESVHQEIQINFQKE